MFCICLRGVKSLNKFNIKLNSPDSKETPAITRTPKTSSLLMTRDQLWAQSENKPFKTFPFSPSPKTSTKAFPSLITKLSFGTSSSQNKRLFRGKVQLSEEELLEERILLWINKFWIFYSHPIGNDYRSLTFFCQEANSVE